MEMAPTDPSSPNVFETVHTVTGYYDGPRSGIADFKGMPYVYESLFEDAPDGSDAFLLQPIDTETFQLAMEAWAIWSRWEKAFHYGQTTIDTHPALPSDRSRHEQLTGMLEPRLRIHPEKARRHKGTFDVHTPTPPGHIPTSPTEWVISWHPEEGTA